MGNVIAFPRARLVLNLDDYVNPYYDITNPIQPPDLPQNWQSEALCLNAADPDIFFKVNRKLSNDELLEIEQRAKAYCNLCPVQPECLTDALMRHEKDGIWGGTTGKERQRILRQIGTHWQHCKNCGNVSFVKYAVSCCRGIRK